mmetsp:Transcript_17709/g.19726  ORF Transcript_17709/g.19726 Transcript_17709/m.19726 type:complete len:162 (-) Transcript_17709:27-512(-)
MIRPVINALNRAGHQLTNEARQYAGAKYGSKEFGLYHMHLFEGSNLRAVADTVKSMRNGWHKIFTLNLTKGEFYLGIPGALCFTWMGMMYGSALGGRHLRGYLDIPAHWVTDKEEYELWGPQLLHSFQFRQPYADVNRARLNDHTEYAGAETAPVEAHGHH